MAKVLIDEYLIREAIEALDYSIQEFANFGVDSLNLALAADGLQNGLRNSKRAIALDRDTIDAVLDALDTAASVSPDAEDADIFDAVILRVQNEIRSGNNRADSSNSD
jgi:hypothetical protein